MYHFFSTFSTLNRASLHFSGYSFSFKEILYFVVIFHVQQGFVFLIVTAKMPWIPASDGHVPLNPIIWSLTLIKSSSSTSRSHLVRGVDFLPGQCLKTSSFKVRSFELNLNNPIPSYITFGLRFSVMDTNIGYRLRCSHHF